MTAPRTTVVIATRDRAGELSRTLRELAALNPPPPVIVVDNHSSDDTSVTARNHGARVVRLRRNLAAAGRDIGVRLARTPYVAFSDDDSWWAPDALANAEKALDAHPRLGLVAAEIVVEPDGELDPVVARMADSPLGWKPGRPGPSVLGFLGCAAVVRVAAFRQVGGFGDLLGFGAEEKLLAFDLAAHGWDLCYLEDVRAHHQPSRSRMPASRRRRLETRNNLLIDWMRRPARKAWDETLRLGARALRDRDAARTLLAALRRAPRALAHRHRLPWEVELAARRIES